MGAPARVPELRPRRLLGDSSFGRHATKHFQATGHPIIESFEPGEDWGWCYVHTDFVELPRQLLVDK